MASLVGKQLVQDSVNWVLLSACGTAWDHLPHQLFSRPKFQASKQPFADTVR